eukprot:CAMPEP_0184647952 /NCGR_PEP_ID=MMETSP0308-20130426/5001_1 /TAXON_ID=38269 /ORGANISM="Gloeochaete witrockiana, Strain SAG 46.84" /LENGTH=235 /DNA_ID=CAMNT_0027079393 /DNA_START=13 /DNA_END=723 /DNA_ORIENTATION=+
MGNAAGVRRADTPVPAFDLAENIARYITEEFERVRANKEQDYLVLDQVLRMKPLREIPISFTHLGTLFVLDSDRDGRISLNELFAFAELFGKRQKLYKSHEYEMQMRAYCTLQMWKVVSCPGGMDSLVKWLCDLFSQCLPVEHFATHPNEVFVNRDVIKTVHEIMNVRASYGIEFQDLFDLMQRVGEDMGTMTLDDEQLDDVVPLSVLRKFFHDFTVGFMQLMTELGFPPALDVD